MTDNDIRNARRRALKLIGGGVALIPLAGLRTAAADGEMPHVAEDDPAAVALGYRHSAADVDVEKYPRKAGEAGAMQKCSNCVLYQGGESWGGCSIFPGKLVNAEGWCNAWAPKA